MDTSKVTRSDKEYMQLERAAFSDPFSFLGPQYQSTDIALRVYMPGADSIEAITENGERFTLVREADSGFVLEGDFDFTTALYQLVVNWPQGEQTICDPYQFHNLIQSGEALADPSLMHSEMGAQLVTLNRGNSSISGVRFLVFAPNASAVSVVGHFNAWDGRRHPMQRLDDGLWGLFIPELEEGTLYKFELKDSAGEGLPHKADPWGYSSEQYPSFASKVFDQTKYDWQDSAWQSRPVTAKHQQALSFYELHAGSWRKNAQGEFLNYRELADELIPYLSDMGYTHVELMPVSEHPFYGSWGYQPIGLFAPTSRFGSPDDFKYFVDQCHQANIGVVLDWVPAHFPSDDHGLANFDGTALFNDPDPRRGWHQDWQSYIYDYGRDHVRRFLVSNALFWFEHYHIDGLRVDAVASMLYLDYSREHDQWIPNHEGGNVNFDAVSLLRWVNEEVYRHYPNAMTIAEESTAFPGVTKPTDMGGLGFGFKWNMGWMHDSLSYIQEEPIHRSYHHNTITFPMVYAFSENYVLSLSHDEVVYGKGSLLDKMPGDEWQKTANLRAYMGYMYGQPGKKLNFMGAEIAQSAEWNHDGQLEWHWLEYPRHSGMKALVKDLNALYTSEPAMYEQDCDPAGFEWRVQDDADNSILAHERIALNGDKVLIVSNFTPVPRQGYTLGVPAEGVYELLLNTDDNKYWGSGADVKDVIETVPVESHGLEQSISLDLPPLSTVFMRFKR
ncbi:1,4-alpha-glucan branching protein GlgB [Photobacterium rosenbergii]|uniref:1,4-alpha-glucan branching protein GlgB n=1 Tax=Photobacterium rosenbergii TaxID=294936 RepID=UPI001C997E67|nr:1,4-alpha-glucan branching protein GlgB [Photobacterium rosenbergii]MBY5946285.1 1,4-alpha-glucan branching protein GlgB [Photobacterium rosenbergii]